MKREKQKKIIAESEGGPKVTLLAALVVGVVLILAYVRCIAPGMQLGDGLELATAAHVLGVPHPTGYPLYMILLKLFLVVTIAGEVIVRTTIFSSLCMAAACGVAVYIVRDLLRYVAPEWPGKARLITAAIAALGMGLLRFHWSAATITEVYALEFLLMVLFVRVAQRQIENPTGRGLIVASLVLGLGLAHHRMSLFMILPYALLWYLGWRPLRDELRRAGLISAAIVAGCLALYLYLPIRAAAHPPINWGNVVDAQRFYDHVTGQEFLERSLLRKSIDRDFGRSEFIAVMGKMGWMLMGDSYNQFLPAREILVPDLSARRIFLQPTPLVTIGGILLWAIAAFGAVVLVRKKVWAITAVILLIAAQNLVLVLTYNIVDIRDYYLFLFWTEWLLIVIALVEGARRVVPAVQERPEIAYALVVLPLIFAGSNWARCDKSTNTDAELLSAVTLPESKEDMPEGSLLLTGGDHDIYTSWYRQYVRGERRDVLVFGSNFIWKSWYPSFFTEEQKRKYKLGFTKSVARDANVFTEQLVQNVIEPNIKERAVFTSTADMNVLMLLDRNYDIRPAMQVGLHNFSDLVPETTVSLWRILPQGEVK